MMNDELTISPTVKQIIDKLPAYNQAYLQEMFDEFPGEHINAVDALAYSFSQAMDLFSIIYPEQNGYAYAEGKWTLGEVFGHLIDAERIFAYRALRIARGDKENQPGWDEEIFANAANYKEREFESIKQEFLCLMESTGHLFDGFNETIKNEVGVANQSEMSAEVVGLLCAGHRLHHFDIIKQRYLTDLWLQKKEH